MRQLVLASTTVVLLALCVSRASAQPVPVWERWEHTMTAAAETPPDTEVTMRLHAPSGKTRDVEAFWDGGRVWRVRFMPGEEGEWRYETQARPAVKGLHGQRGAFTATKGKGANRFTRHGAIRVAPDGWTFQHADGTPFFWLADTAWNGALHSTAEEWTRYLDDRLKNGFTAVQLVTTQWRAGHASEEGEVAYTGFERIGINPAFFQRLDARMDTLNRKGLLAAPVLLWTLGTDDKNPGRLPEDQAIRMARYLVARYGAHHVAWLLAGDERFEGDKIERWRRIGRAVFGDTEHAPVTLHPQGRHWPFEHYREEPWLDFLGYQSSHSAGADVAAWIHSGPPAEAWKKRPAKPIINLEPAYEQHRGGRNTTRVLNEDDVRRAVYWSLLNAPTAGVSYGAHGIWSWERKPAVPLEHPNAGVAQPWSVALAYPGAAQMRRMAELFTSLPWWTLRPAPELLASPQPRDPQAHVSASRCQSGQCAVLYLPQGGEVALTPAQVPTTFEAHWMDPREGTRTPAADQGGLRFKAPDRQDWVLVLRRHTGGAH